MNTLLYKYLSESSSRFTRSKARSVFRLLVIHVTQSHPHQWSKSHPSSLGGLPRWLRSKNPPANAGDAGDSSSVPGL